MKSAKARSGGRSYNTAILYNLSKNKRKNHLMDTTFCAKARQDYAQYPLQSTLKHELLTGSDPFSIKQ